MPRIRYRVSDATTMMQSILIRRVSIEVLSHLLKFRNSDLQKYFIFVNQSSRSPEVLTRWDVKDTKEQLDGVNSARELEIG